MQNTERSLHDILTEIDNIEDDEEFVDAEHEAVIDYCENKNYDLTDEDWDIICSRGLEDTINYNRWEWEEDNNLPHVEWHGIDHSE